MPGLSPTFPVGVETGGQRARRLAWIGPHDLGKHAGWPKRAAGVADPATVDVYPLTRSVRLLG